MAPTIWHAGRVHLEHVGEDAGDQPDQHQLLEDRPLHRRHVRIGVGDVEHRRRSVDVDTERPIGRTEPLAHAQRDEHDAADRGEDRQQHQRSVAERVGPTRRAVDAEHGLLHEVGEVVLGDVDPPLLGQLDEDPDERGDPDDRPPAHAARVPARPDHLVGDEEVLERVRERP